MPQSSRGKSFSFSVLEIQNILHPALDEDNPTVSLFKALRIRLRSHAVSATQLPAVAASWRVPTFQTRSDYWHHRAACFVWEYKSSDKEHSFRKDTTTICMIVLHVDQWQCLPTRITEVWQLIRLYVARHNFLTKVNFGQQLSNWRGMHI